MVTTMAGGEKHHVVVYDLQIAVGYPYEAGRQDIHLT